MDSSPTLQKAGARPTGKALSQGQGTEAKIREARASGGCNLTPLCSWPSLLVSLLTARPHRGLLGGAKREGGRERQEALLELSRGNFVGKGDKEEHQKESQGVWRGAWWIKFYSSWERR